MMQAGNKKLGNGAMCVLLREKGGGGEDCGYRTQVYDHTNR